MLRRGQRLSYMLRISDCSQDPEQSRVYQLDITEFGLLVISPVSQYLREVKHLRPYHLGTI